MQRGNVINNKSSVKNFFKVYDNKNIKDYIAIVDNIVFFLLKENYFIYSSVETKCIHFEKNNEKFQMTIEDRYEKDKFKDNTIFQIVSPVLNIKNISFKKFNYNDYFAKCETESETYIDSIENNSLKIKILPKSNLLYYNPSKDISGKIKKQIPSLIKEVLKSE